MGISAYTMIRLADGTEKRAEDIAPGDVTADPAAGTARTVKKVWQGPGVGMCRLTAAGGSTLDVTEDQTVMTARGPVPAGTAAAGEMLSVAGALVPCIEAGRLMGDYMVYDIVLECPAGETPYLLAGGFVTGASR